MNFSDFFLTTKFNFTTVLIMLIVVFTLGYKISQNKNLITAQQNNYEIMVYLKSQKELKSLLDEHDLLLSSTIEALSSQARNNALSKIPKPPEVTVWDQIFGPNNKYSQTLINNKLSLLSEL